MREGENPVRDQLLEPKNTNHRIIIPLYIPSDRGFYADSWRIFEICLESLYKFSVGNFKVSVIGNGCSSEVELKLTQLKHSGKIDELYLVSENIGKLNSILKALRSTNERVVTITDGDVLFSEGWDETVYEIFSEFPKAAAVSPTPVFRTHNRLTHNIWFDHFFSKKLKFEPVADPEALTRFAKSIGWSRLEDKWKDVILTLSSRSGAKAVVGNSHFCVTYRRECLYRIPKENSIFKLGGDSELIYLDIPPLKFDGYRLAAHKNHAYHIGNRLEEWVVEMMNKPAAQKKNLEFRGFTKLKYRPIRYWLKFKLFRKLMSVGFIKRRFYRKKGLTPEQLTNFSS